MKPRKKRSLLGTDPNLMGLDEAEWAREVIPGWFVCVNNPRKLNVAIVKVFCKANEIDTNSIEYRWPGRDFKPLELSEDLA